MSTEISRDMHVICSDLLPNILVSLPLKSVMQFTLVSKSWYTLISESRLLLISKQDPTVKGVIFWTKQQPILEYLPLFDTSTSTTIAPSTKLDFEERGFRLYPVQSCNGLLLSQCYWLNQTDGNQIHDRYYVSNIATKRHCLLPEPDGRFKVWHYPKAICLAFDPSKSPHYKVVALMKLRIYIAHVLQIYVYSSDSNSWRVSGCEPFNMIEQVNYNSGVYCNGAIHWISSRPTSSSFYFSIQDDVLKPMPDMPIKPTCAEVGDPNYSPYFGESHGHLLFARMGFKRLEVYQMNKDYSGWFLKHNVNVLEMTTSEYDYRLVKLLSITHSFLVFTFPRKVIRFDLVSNTSQIIHHHTESELDIRAFNYIESLSSV